MGITSFHVLSRWSNAKTDTRKFNHTRDNIFIADLNTKEKSRRDEINKIGIQKEFLKMIESADHSEKPERYHWAWPRDVLFYGFSEKSLQTTGVKP